MSPERAATLFQRFPSLYRFFGGFHCGEGWFDLIERLSAQLEPVSLAAPPDQPVFVEKIGHRFGGLHFCLNRLPPGVGDLIWTVEHESLRVCERCGAVGELRVDATIRTLCDGCEKQRTDKR